MDLSKLSKTDKIISVAGIVLFVSAFLPWFKFDVGAIGFSHDFSGWDVGLFWAGLPAILGLAAAAAIIASKAGGATLPELPVPFNRALLIAGGVSAVIVVLKLAIGEDYVDRSYGLFLATLAALAFAAGGYLASKEE